MISVLSTQSLLSKNIPTRMAPITVRLNPLGIAIMLVTVVCLLIYITGIPVMFQIKQGISMKELLSASIELAERGGDRVRTIAEESQLKEKVKGKTLEGAKEMLTDGDLASHLTIIHGFQKSFPSLMDRLVSEEHLEKDIDLSEIPDVNRHREDIQFVGGEQMVRPEDITIWIDPLDATQEYTEHLNEYVTVLICVAVRGQPTLGVIHKPFEKETYWGWVGYGYSGNASPAQMNNPDDNTPLEIIVSRSHQGTVEDVVKDAFGSQTKVIPAGGAGYKTLQVIQGNADAYVHVTRIKKWDVCAGNAIITATKGRMTTLDGQPIDYAKTGNEDDAMIEMGILATLHAHTKFLTGFEKEAEKLRSSKKL